VRRFLSNYFDLLLRLDFTYQVKWTN